MKFLEKFRKPSRDPMTIEPVQRCAAPSKRNQGADAEQHALNFLLQQKLRLIARNYRTPGRGGGEIDLIMLNPDGTLVFIEVRQRSNAQFGGAGASIGPQKQQRIILTATHFLATHQEHAQRPCRFDAVLLTSNQSASLEWIVAAFDAS